MATDEENAVAEYLKNGVDLPDLKAKDGDPEGSPKGKSDDEPDKGDAKGKIDDKNDDPDLNKAPLQDKEPAQPRKRSIYDEYKDKKSELKTEKELRENAEKERDEALSKLAAIGKADNPEDKKEAEDAFDAFAKEINADPKAIKQLRDLILKDVKPANDDGMSERLARFEAWEKTNSLVIEKSLFNEDFTKIAPTLKELFPTVNETELGAIKTELDTIAHTKEWHDKDLGYVAFMNKDKLSALVSPKKRGLESRGRKESGDTQVEFDPNADYSKMTSAERTIWEKQYKDMTRSSEIVTDGKGKKLIL